MSEEWDAEKVAAECAAAGRAKARKKVRRKRGAPPPIEEVSEAHPEDPAMRDPETGTFLPGHPPHPGAGRPKGTPDKYDAERHPAQAKKLAQLGATLAQMADIMEVALSTVKLWQVQHLEFAEAVKAGKAPADDRVERSMFELATGFEYDDEQVVKLRDAAGNERYEIVKVRKVMPPDPGSVFKWLANRRPDEWRERREVTVGGAILHIPAPDEARRQLYNFLKSGTAPIPLPPPAPDLGTEDDKSIPF